MISTYGSWQSRPIEISNLLNPAFCGEILYSTIKSYQSTSDRNFPFSLLFLVLPIILHSDTRRKIPPRKDLYSWIIENPEITLGFAERVQSLIPITKESIIFLLQMNVLDIDDNGDFLLISSIKKREKEFDIEIEDCIESAKKIGIRFAQGGSPHIVYAMWGVRP